MRPEHVPGTHGQQAAEEYLQEHGMRILDRNWRSDDGELPIVAVSGGTLVVCAIITRTGSRYHKPLDRAAKRLRARMRRGAVQWLAAHGARYDKIRVDLIGLLPRRHGGWTIEHIKAAG